MSARPHPHPLLRYIFSCKEASANKRFNEKDNLLQKHVSAELFDQKRSLNDKHTIIR